MTPGTNEKHYLVLSPLRKLAKITAEKVNHLHRNKVGHWVLRAPCFVSKVNFLVLFLWLWFFFCGSGSFPCDKVKPKSRFTSPFSCPYEVRCDL